MQMSIDDLVDPDFKTYKQLHELKDRFYDQDEIFVVIRTTDKQVPNQSQLCAVSAWIQETVDTRGDVIAVVSTLGVARPTETTQEYRAQPLIKLNCADRTLNDTTAIAKGLNEIKASPFRGTLTSEVADDVAILIYPSARVTASIKGTFNPAIVDELQKSFQEKVLDRETNLTASWSGDGIFQYYLHRGYEHMPVLNLLMSFLIIIAFRLFFGTFRSSWIFLLVVTATTIPLYAGMALAGHPIDVLSSAISLMIFIGAIEDFIFLSHFMREWSWKRAFPRVILPSFCTSFTTAIGFGSLMFSDLSIIQRFGFWAAAGSLLEWLMMFLFLPALLTIFPKMTKWVRNEKSFVPKPTWLFEARPPRWATVILLFAFPLSYFAAQGLHVSDSPEKLLHPDHIARKALDIIESTRGWRAQLSLVFADAENHTLNQSVLANVKSWPLVDQIEDATSVRSYLTDHLSENMKNYTESLIHEGTIGHRLGPQGGESRALLYVKNLETVQVNQMRRDVQLLCPNNECWLAGSLVSYGELGERILSTLYESLTGSLVFVSIVILFLCFCYRPKDFPALVLSSMWGPVSLMLVFYAFKIPVSYITSMIASIVVGLAGDNAIHFMMFTGRRKNLSSSVSNIGPASLIVTICTVLAASTFFAGYFDPMRMLGLLMMTGLILSFLGDILILRGISRSS